jgi:hypothetical protein
VADRRRQIAALDRRRLNAARRPFPAHAERV